MNDVEMISMPFAGEEERKNFYAKLAKNKTLLISLDPGYDAFKICINGEFLFTRKSLALHPQATERFAEQLSDDATTKIELRNEEGKIEEYILGAEVTSIRDTPSSTSADNRRLIELSEEKEARFGTESFRASMIMAIVTALHKYALEKNSVKFSVKDVEMDEWQIALGVALPTEYKDASKKNVAALLEQPVTADVTIGSSTYHYKKWDFSLSRAVVYTSQVKAAYNTELMFGDGTFNEKVALEKIKHELPTVILDFGRMTFGATELNEYLNIEPGNPVETDPNRFAMLAFEQKTAELINAQYGDRLKAPVTAAAIDPYCDGTDDLYVARETGRGNQPVDVRQIRSQVIRESIPELVDYVDSKYNIERVHSILVCGGTGSILFNDIRDNYDWKDFQNLVAFRRLDAYGAGMVYAVTCGTYLEVAKQYLIKR